MNFDLNTIYGEFLRPWIFDHGIKILIILLVAYIIQKFIKHFIEKGVRKAIKDDPLLSRGAEKKREDTLIKIINGISKALIWVIALMMALSEAGVNIGPLIAGAGVVGIAIGFGGQYLIRDLISGLFIILENQYRIGDAVEIAGIDGKVEDISLRVTILRDLDGEVHHIPHGEVTTVTNKTMGVSKVNLDFGVSYDTNLDQLRDLINKVGNELAEDSNYGELIRSAPQFLRVDNLADSAVIVKITGEVEPGEQWAVTGELRKRLKEACDKEGIEIPFPQIVVHQSK